MNKSLHLASKSIFLSAAFLLLTLSLSSCSKPVEATKISGPTMGTSYNITLYPAEGETLDQAELQAKIDDSLKRINQQMSTWIKDSEISNFNNSQSTEWFPVSPEFATVTQAAQKISKLSEGAFDITLSPLITLWGFGKDFKNNNPSDEAIAEALKSVGYQNLSVRTEPPALRKSIPELRINLGAIAKGYAVDAIAEELADAGINDYLVEIGGEIRANGKKPNGSLWRIAVEKPSAKERSIERGLLIENLGVATSGDYRNYFERDGKRYSHTINAVTGRPITHQLASITVLNESAMMADGYATAIMVLGEEEGKAFIQENNLLGYTISRDSDGFKSWDNLPTEMSIKP
ncbi:FAD:protein FMN transferase [Leucothrix sargassi]|nr:FAD:protein FMN transferase [Leucothrix sargassi]